MGIIHSIVYQPEPSNVSVTRFNRVPVDSVELIEGHGIKGDRKAGRHPNRHLNIMMRETLDHLAECGYQTGAGEMGEQFQISGIDIENLPQGTLLKIGESAVVHLNKPRTGCTWLEQVQGKRCDKTVGKLGIMATVMASGTVRIGDSVEVMAVPEIA